jgi:hypothetical protein
MMPAIEVKRTVAGRGRHRRTGDPFQKADLSDYDALF